MWKCGSSEGTRLETQKITIQETVDMLEITYGRVPSIFKDNLNMHHTATKFMLHLLNEMQTENHINT